MKRLGVLSLFIFVVVGCGSSPDYLTGKKRSAIKCAENWKAKGYSFDPNSMTCSQMSGRVQAIRRAEFWAEKGYVFDSNSMTTDEMDLKVKDIDRARHWKKNKGYDFDPNSMTVRQMDQKAEELDTIAYWKKAGYYYDPNTQTVFLTAQRKTELKSLASLHDTKKIKYGNQFSYSPPPRSSPSGKYQVYETTRTDSQAKRVKRDTIFKFKQDNYINPEQQPYFSAPYPTMATQSPPLSLSSLGALGVNKYHPDSLANPYGAGSPYKLDGLMNPYSKYGSPYSNKSWRNPHAMDAPRLYDSQGNYRGKLSTNPYDPDSIFNPFSRYGNPYALKPIYVVPSTK